MANFMMNISFVAEVLAKLARQKIYNHTIRPKRVWYNVAVQSAKLQTLQLMNTINRTFH